MSDAYIAGIIFLSFILFVSLLADFRRAIRFFLRTFMRVSLTLSIMTFGYYLLFLR